jgi:hypothetical protein
MGIVRAPKQKPCAVVVGCSDAQVPTEMLFGQGFDNLFVTRVAGRRRSYGDPLDDIPCNFPTPAVVDPRRPRIGVARKILHILQRHVLLQEVGHGGYPEC